MRGKLYGTVCALGMALACASAHADGQDGIFEICVRTAISDARDTILHTAPDLCTNANWRRLSVPVLYDGKIFYPPTDQKHTSVEKAIILVHGSGSNPSGMYAGLEDNLNASVVDADPSRIWIVAPIFQETLPQPIACPTAAPAVAPTLYWTKDEDAGYNQGDVSICPESSVVQVSSFDLMDHLIRKMKLWAPNISQVVVIGFSSGGKFVNRYSMATTVEANFPCPGPDCVNFRYVISSPSAYTYLNRDRYRVTQAGVVKPRTAIDAECSDPDQPHYYNDFPYGLEEMLPAPHYMTGPTPAQYIDKLKSKSRLIMVGGIDTGSSDGNLPFPCAAEQQSNGRLNRAKTYWHHLKSSSVQAADHAAFCTVAGVKHDGKAMVGSAAATSFWRDGDVTEGGTLLPGCFLAPAGP